ncbi:MAG: alanine--tRNA ligase [Actinobacteria bacterium]|nr:alanine--tRNA ligase [Actinomycetota bacterium]
MDSAQIRRRWLSFFESENKVGLNHTVVPSASLVADDPNLLLINAGMVPFKPFFLGELAPPYPRATSVQKCVRTLDIDEVGKTTRHGSFFQMCGNFSFGDYFKEGAIALAWELLTKPVSDGGYGFPESKLWVTVYHDDDEAASIWEKQIGIPQERIQRRGMADNFWSMGVPGPCGPCSEIYFDRGAEYGREGGPVADEDRYLEIWNLVFMQFERGAGSGKEDFPILGDLPKKSIDTGLGLERTAALLQGVENIYEIDTTRKILDTASMLTGKKYGVNAKNDVSLRVIADHARTAAMLICDGVTPGNEGRGYILRRMMRRTIRNMRILGAQDPTIVELMDSAIGAMGPQYPELQSDRNRITQVAASEEESFLQTLRSGTTLFESAADDLKKRKSATISGDDAFKLHDTYGFPIDLTLEMAEEIGLKVDQEAFKKLMSEQKSRAKADAKAKKTGHTDLTVYRSAIDAAGATTFLGYEHFYAEAKLAFLLSKGVPVSSAKVGDEVEVILDRTPFYAEGGGQVADWGKIVNASGSTVEIEDVQAPLPGLFVHRGKVTKGEITLHEQVFAEIDSERRHALSRSHTATHMVHKSFREALGETATQAGTENQPGRFRFDFAAVGAVSASTMSEVEDRVNSQLILDLPVSAEVMSQAEAKRTGAIALFGEKYGDEVRVISVGDWAKELCGGTHVSRSSQLGIIKLLGESSIGSGVRRVEALVGVDAYRFFAREHLIINSVSEAVKATKSEELPERIETVLDRLKNAEKEIAQFKSKEALGQVDELLKKVKSSEGINSIITTVKGDLNNEDLRAIAGALMSRMNNESSVIALFTAGVKPIVIAQTNEASRTSGVRAGEMVKRASKALGGGGGGKDDFAQGGGVNAKAIPDAIKELEAYLATIS